eukprot:CAMPEP_0184482566 /NCGR_PEP_ID=MMETSP0113_2-20130426/4133_1 /TAXON_ID=91329 /ORGANISM="Norrisiella sphaerica, Strain BC52" /LENGTH=736 /DNA_ID=CAMNT_0026862379 /DNA_START=123 /DNA_END=2329 /DNA_ORIENTATION=+
MRAVMRWPAKGRRLRFLRYWSGSGGKNGAHLAVFRRYTPALRERKAFPRYYEQLGARGCAVLKRHYSDSVQEQDETDKEVQLQILSEACRRRDVEGATTVVDYLLDEFYLNSHDRADIIETLSQAEFYDKCEEVYSKASPEDRDQRLQGLRLNYLIAWEAKSGHGVSIDEIFKLFDSCREGSGAAGDTEANISAKIILMLTRRGDHDEALKFYVEEGLGELQSLQDFEREKVLKELARGCYGNPKYKHLYPQLVEALRQIPGQRSLLSLYLDLRCYDEAVEYVEQTSQTDDEVLDGLYEVSKAILVSGSPRDFKKSLRLILILDALNIEWGDAPVTHVLLRIACKVGDVPKAEKIFTKLRKHEDLTSKDITEYLHLFRAQGLPVNLEDIWDIVLLQKLSLEVPTYQAMIQSAESEGKVLQELHLAIQAFPSEREALEASAVDNLVRLGCFERAMQLCTGERGPELEAAYVRMLTSRKDRRLIRKYLEEMPEKLDPHVAGHVVTMLFENGHVSRAKAVFKNSILEAPLDLTTAQGPDGPAENLGEHLRKLEFATTQYLEACAKHNQLPHAVEILDKLQEQDFPVHPKAFNSLISVSKNVKASLQIYKHVVSRGKHANNKAVESLFQMAFNLRNFEMLRTVYHNTPAMALPRNFTSVLRSMFVCLKAVHTEIENREEAVEILEALLESLGELQERHISLGNSEEEEEVKGHVPGNEHLQPSSGSSTSEAGKLRAASAG